MKNFLIIYDSEQQKQEAESFTPLLTAVGWKYTVCENTRIGHTDGAFIVYFCSATEPSIEKCKEIIQGLAIKRDQYHAEHCNDTDYVRSEIYTLGIDLRTAIKGARMLGMGEGKQLFNLLCGIEISYGCNNFCTYCRIPYAQGRVTNRDADEILKEFRERVTKNHVSQIIDILGTSISDYKCPRTGLGYAGLLEKFCEIIVNENAPHQLCFDIHPKDFSRELLDVVKKYPKILCNILLPLQSGSDRILKLMNRRYTVKQYLQIISDLRASVANVRLATHIICGFPTETEEDFQQTIDIVKRVMFTALAVLPYFSRKLTVAREMQGHLDKCVIMERVERLQKIYHDLGGGGGTPLLDYNCICMLLVNVKYVYEKNSSYL